MKKWIALVLSLLLVLGLCACDAQPQNTDGGEQTPAGNEVSDGASGGIPEGGSYVLADGTRLEAGSPFPAAPSVGDIYRYGDYEYRYGQHKGESQKWEATDGHWGVYVRDTEKTNYGQILDEILGKPITSVCGTFRKCQQMTSAPAIPATVTNMSHTFYECSALVTAPQIPEGVTDMAWCFNACSALTSAPELPDAVQKLTSTFRDCVSLTEAPQIPAGVTRLSSMFEGCTNLSKVNVTIPESVEEMDRMFYSCANLSGTVTINAEPIKYTHCFYWVDFSKQDLTLTGSSSLLRAIGNTGKNYPG